MRLFIGVPLTPTLRSGVAACLTGLRQHGVVGKWVEAENLHLTIAFLGTVESKMLPQIYAAAQRAAQAVLPFAATFKNLERIPRVHPRVLAISVGPQEPFQRLQRQITQALKPLKVACSTKPVHLTLVRLKQPLPRLLGLPGALGLARLPLRELWVIQSTLTPKGPRYSPLRALKLGPTAQKGGFRSNIAVCVVNPNNEVLLVRAIYHSANDWHFPQGGIEPHETLLQAAKRELREEVGIANFQLLRLKERVYQYRLPQPLIDLGVSGPGQGYTGKVQSLAIVKVGEARPKLKPDVREAAEVRWVPLIRLLPAMGPVRRPLGRIAMLELEQLIT